MELSINTTPKLLSLADHISDISDTSQSTSSLSMCQQIGNQPTAIIIQNNNAQNNAHHILNHLQHQSQQIQRQSQTQCIPIQQLNIINNALQTNVISINNNPVNINNVNSNYQTQALKQIQSQSQPNIVIQNMINPSQTTSAIAASLVSIISNHYNQIGI